MKRVLIASLTSIFLSSQATASVLPKNDLHLQPVPESAGMTEEEFNTAIKRVADLYVPIVKEAHNVELRVYGLWENETVNAAAGQSIDHWYVKVYGGLARRPELTYDGLLLALCHEMGHHLAGFPVKARLSSEGQSDMFSTLSCGRLLLADDFELNSKYRNIIPKYPKELCDASWDGENEQNLCYRLMLAGKSLASIFAVKKDVEIDFDTPDPKVVPYTFTYHPKPQCRLDTYMAGAICRAEFDPYVIPGKDVPGKTKVREKASAAYNCSILNDDTLGLRPRCWFGSKFD